MIGINSKQIDMVHAPLFKTLKRFSVSPNEKVIVILGDDAKRIAGVIDEICDDGEHFWMRTSPSPYSDRYKFSFKLDQIVKLN